ncbi:MAG: glutamine--fructose-6-phosphate transaminase (isomerizing) [Xanthomonadales bacterium]|nr:glutamine--fructose-6-phosphate transaminase (isomerizing) [Gammaproteobacteria bacterium]MBT8052429.1 glutamine--fructose-6-phosphate transaminase (isomerizing) [Gammaproteobacteria bacterium]NND55946.1 glutamine--fructose-6-phosphate transaminase (isomerizing) [Xanthomonadales bacterium]NNK50531.1 glutamine--fructose-6-phosphate transaminase (isomerizing) [Xanthomonadales bacterium]
MCGIVGATANREVIDVIINGLRTLEYRGYDSAGIAVPRDGAIRVRKRTGKITELEQYLQTEPLQGTCAIGHTRWATHGKPSQNNAHPHVSNHSIAVVHNGIIENSVQLREMLVKAGYVFESETDTEVVPHLVHFYLAEGDGFSGACRKAIGLLEGSYALAITCVHEPGKIVAARKGSPLVIGAGDGAYFVASDLPALLAETDSFYLLEEGDIAEMTADTCRIWDEHGLEVQRVLTRSSDSVESISKGGFDHFMQKEIFEQPRAVADTLSGRLDQGRVTAELISAECEQWLNQAEQVHIIACGTSWHAGMVTKYWLESLCRIPCHVEIASEFRYREPAVPKNTLFVAISQSGETADTLAALRFARTAGYLATLAVCNVANSSLDRECDATLLTRAGAEIGVASTKALTTQLVVLALLTLKCAELKGVDPVRRQDLAGQLERLPALLEKALQLEPQVREMAQSITVKQHALFLGRGKHYPIAQEAALKLKEISYIHAEAYAAGELKHGPLALVDENMPVVAVCPNDALLEKLVSNIEEVRARGGQLYVLADHASSHGLCREEQTVIELDASGEFISPIVFNVPLQLLAYHAAVLRGTDIDQPRNLAKSVTVE